MLHQETQDRMINITKFIKQATSTDIFWQMRERNLFLSYLNSIGCQINYSEEENNWAVVSLNEETFMYVWANYPLVFIKNDISISNLIARLNGITVVYVQDFNEENFCIDFDEVKDYLDYIEHKDKFSVVDLWFYTNSK